MTTESWKFTDPPDAGVIITRQVLREGQLLSMVSHNLEGDWQFLHDDEADERDIEDAMLVCLEGVVRRFPEVEQLADLPIGWIAWRDLENDPWVREPRSNWATE